MGTPMSATPSCAITEPSFAEWRKTVHPDDWPEVERRFPGSKAIAFGHLGDGNVHFHVLAPADAVPGAWEESEGKKISALVHDLVTRWHGSISAEHGIGQMKRDELARLSDPASMGLLRAVKQALDPHRIMNPGKLIA